MMKKQILKINSGFWQKRIPTILGLSVLVVGLVAGILIFGQGTGVFSPRATPETTPKQIVISNITERGFTVSFVTDEATPGYVKYGLKDNSLKDRVGDDRDQIRGTISDYKLHHITVTGLQDATQYYFILGTGSGDHYANSSENSINSEAYTVTTAKRGGVAPSAKTIYGSVVTEGGVPANGAIVYSRLDGAIPMSSLVKESGSWAIPLSSARQIGTLEYAPITDDAKLTIQIHPRKNALMVGHCRMQSVLFIIIFSSHNSFLVYHPTSRHHPFLVSGEHPLLGELAREPSSVSLLCGVLASTQTSPQGRSRSPTPQR